MKYVIDYDAEGKEAARIFINDQGRLDYRLTPTSLPEDELSVRRIIERPIYTQVNGKHRIIDPRKDPQLFLENLRWEYRGVAPCSGVIEGDLFEAVDTKGHAHAPAGNHYGGRFVRKSGSVLHALSPREEIKAKLKDSLAKADNLTPAIREKYYQTMKSVFAGMNDKAVERVNGNLRAFHWCKDQPELQQVYNEKNPKHPLETGVILGGYFEAKPRRDQPGGYPYGSITLDGDAHPSEGVAKHIYAHELGHALDGELDADGLTDHISNSDEWISAGVEEICDRKIVDVGGGYGRIEYPLTEYATTSPCEGFAEFMRLCWTDKEQAKKFPKCYKVLKDRGLA